MPNAWDESDERQDVEGEIDAVYAAYAARAAAKVKKAEELEHSRRITLKGKLLNAEIREDQGYCFCRNCVRAVMLLQIPDRAACLRPKPEVDVHAGTNEAASSNWNVGCKTTD